MRVEAGDGLAAARKRRRRLWTTIAMLAGSGAVVGFLSARFEVEGGGFLEGIPAAWAIVASLILVVSIIVGSWRYHLVTDELERRDGMWASAFALNVYFLGYATWYLWWKGGLVTEPSHEAIGIAVFVTAALAYGYKKIRP